LKWLLLANLCGKEGRCERVPRIFNEKGANAKRSSLGRVSILNAVEIGNVGSLSLYSREDLNLKGTGWIEGEIRRKGVDVDEGRR
jgi:hypothetical protein